jgi:hypothetical protein
MRVWNSGSSGSVSLVKGFVEEEGCRFGSGGGSIMDKEKNWADESKRAAFWK